MADPSCPRSYDYFLLAEAQRREANDNGNRHSLDDVLAEMLMKPRASDALLRAMVEAVLGAGEELPLRDWKRDAGFDAAKAVFFSWPHAELKEDDK